MLLGKNPGVRPIGVGEVLRRIIGKAFNSSNEDRRLKAAESVQLMCWLCRRLELRGPPAYMCAIFADAETDTILFVHA